MTTLQICPPHLSDVATLPWEIQKVIGTRCMSLHGVDVKTLVIIINKAFENVKNVGENDQISLMNVGCCRN